MITSSAAHLQSLFIGRLACRMPHLTHHRTFRPSWSPRSPRRSRRRARCKIGFQPVNPLSIRLNLLVNGVSWLRPSQNCAGSSGPAPENRVRNRRPRPPSSPILSSRFRSCRRYQCQVHGNSLCRSNTEISCASHPQTHGIISGQPAHHRPVRRSHSQTRSPVSHRPAEPYPASPSRSIAKTNRKAPTQYPAFEI